jgi:hypothetical protein
MKDSQQRDIIRKHPQVSKYYENNIISLIRIGIEGPKRITTEKQQRNNRRINGFNNSGYLSNKLIRTNYINRFNVVSVTNFYLIYTSYLYGLFSLIVR